LSGRQGNKPQSPVQKILVAEDDVAYRRIVALQLRAAGFVCLTASTHAEALQKFQDDCDIGVILLDYTMNGRAPDALVGQLNPLRRHPRIIGHSSMDRRRDFAALGVREFLLKPLDVGRFIQLLTETTDSGQPRTLEGQHCPPSP
jgi:DNA-binding NtrC family response regulator